MLYDISVYVSTSSHIMALMGVGAPVRRPSLSGVSTALPKVNPLVICFTVAPIAVQTRRVISGKPIII